VSAHKKGNMAKLEELQTRIQERFKDTVTCKIEHEQITLEIAPNDLVKCCVALRDELDFQFEQLMDICGVDYLTYGVSEWATDTATSEGFSRGVNVGAGLCAGPEVGVNVGAGLCAGSDMDASKRFAVVYHLLSITRNQRLRIRCYAASEPPRVPTVINVWQSADWYEREAFDLYGILFEGHPDLRRILSDYGFIGHPFRKDFPLIGQVEMRYDATEGRVIYEPVSIEPRTLVPKIIRHVGHSAIQTEEK
jgi:NADH-quinone oxidoreductase subunit C